MLCRPRHWLSLPSGDTQRASTAIRDTGLASIRQGVGSHFAIWKGGRGTVSVKGGAPAASAEMSGCPPIAGVLLHRRELALWAKAQSRCAPARCAGARAERPVASREDADSEWRAPS
jgi:hypothetical protein